MRGRGLILAIESSCDETAAAVVERGARTLSSVVASQISTHARYGGVVPELASREHLRAIVPVVRAALAQANVALADLDAIAVRHQNHAKVRADSEGAAEEAEHHVGSCAGGHVVVGRHAAQQQVAHAAAGKVGLKARRAQLRNHPQSRIEFAPNRRHSCRFYCRPSGAESRSGDATPVN